MYKTKHGNSNLPGDVCVWVMDVQKY